MQGASTNDRPLVYRLADFNLWIDGTGALASHKASLDWRLKERPIDLTLVKGNLVLLYQFTQDYADLQAKHLLLDEALRNIDSSLANLSSLGVAIRRTGRKARLLKADGRFNEEEHSELKLHLQCIIALRPSQERRGDNEFEERLDALTSIQRRLIQANLKRRNRFLQAQKHSVGLKKRVPDTKSVPVSSGDSTHLEITIQHPLEYETNNPDSLSAPDASRKDLGIKKTAPTLSGTSASMPRSNLRYVDPAHKKSEGSTSHTEITRIAASTHYPRPRMPSTDQKVFQCPCCCQMLSVEEFKSDDRWRQVTY
ncbi:hypothetical protein F53441_4806 [Fusarium austroafricanum]|uniref:Uncharacterized protein n=1 Tax=Fusarium austroafricanum TaxID=2364996 RepID=A0A8H4NV58_9HYPO|nr:hypothetical protein F53441_4806 [Fusarium austroafricanum]